MTQPKHSTPANEQTDQNIRNLTTVENPYTFLETLPTTQLYSMEAYLHDYTSSVGHEIGRRLANAKPPPPPNVPMCNLCHHPVAAGIAYHNPHGLQFAHIGCTTRPPTKEPTKEPTE